MIQVSLRDVLFPHAKSACNGDLGILPAHITFDRNPYREHPITFFTDKSLGEATLSNSKVKIAWILESPDLFSDIYEQIARPEIYSRFDYILTHKKELVGIDDRFIFCPFGGCWIRPEAQKIYPKSSLVSIIASGKTDLEGHKLRHEVIDQYKDSLSAVLGRGYKEFDDKVDGLKAYRYSITIENCREDYWFTEKLIDCFMTGTVPIYWGCPGIGKFFDTDGMITFKDSSELPGILSKLSEEDYIKRLPAIKRNFETAKSYTVTEDYIFNEILKKLPKCRDIIKEHHE